MPSIKQVEGGQVFVVANAPVHIDGVWECGDQRFTDPDGTAYSKVVEFSEVGPIHFKMLFTAQERLKAKELRANDLMLDDFWELIEDPRTDVVNLALQSVQQAVEYTLTVVSTAGIEVDVPARKAAILSGVLQ